MVDLLTKHLTLQRCRQDMTDRLVYDSAVNELDSKVFLFCFVFLVTSDPIFFHTRRLSLHVGNLLTVTNDWLHYQPSVHIYNCSRDSFTST